MKKRLLSVFLLSLLLALPFYQSPAAAAQGVPPVAVSTVSSAQTGTPAAAFDPAALPKYSGTPYTAVNGNLPFFTAEEKRNCTAFENYSALDSFGRCGVAYANICRALMPTEERESISEVKPTGWHSSQYDFIGGKSLYNRCHLIGFQLAGENANERNLITGTRYLNIEGMLPFENMVADYVKETGNHVLYRVTPVFTGNNLLADGVRMEGWSVEDEGEGICFHVFAYNVQPGVILHYATGNNRADPAGVPTQNAAPSAGGSSGSTPPAKPPVTAPAKTGSSAPAASPAKVSSPAPGSSVSASYVLNTNTKKFHHPDCGSAAKISVKNRKSFTGSRSTLISQGYSPCGNCKP